MNVDREEKGAEVQGLGHNNTKRLGQEENQSGTEGASGEVGRNVETCEVLGAWEGNVSRSGEKSSHIRTVNWPCVL